MAILLSGLNTLRCGIISPNSDGSFQGLPRWSTTNVGKPALVVIPETEQDVQAAIRVARDNHLSIVTGGGGHGTFVPVGPENVYIDMSKFRTIELDKDHGIVQVGGGVLSGELLRALASHGYYTPLPNSNAVGVVGCVLGGGSTAFNGLHGYMADIVVSFRLVTSEGDIIEVEPSSSGNDQALFNALCGAGHGLGVITSLKTSAYPITDLNMTKDQIWTRSLIFPGSAIETAVQAFMGLPSPSPAARNGITFLRSPPGTPSPGAPIIIVGSTYFGPGDKAEAEATVLFREDIVSKAFRANTDMMPMTNLNDNYEPQNTRGGHKSLASCRLGTMQSAAIKTAYNQWLSATEKYPDARRSLLAITSHNSARHEELGRNQTNQSKFVESRDRGFSVFAIAICDEVDTMAGLREWFDDTMAGFRNYEKARVPRSFPNNLRFGMSLYELFDRERLLELKRVKQIWDADKLFWSPYEA